MSDVDIEYLSRLLDQKSDSLDHQSGIFADDQTNEIQAIWEAAEARRDSRPEAISEMTQRRKSRSIGATYERVKAARKDPGWQAPKPERSTIISGEPKLVNWGAHEEIPESRSGRKIGVPRRNYVTLPGLRGSRTDQAEPEPRADAPWADVYERQADGSLKLVSENSPDELLVDPRRLQAKTDALTRRRKNRSLPTT